MPRPKKVIVEEQAEENAQQAASEAKPEEAAPADVDSSPAEAPVRQAEEVKKDPVSKTYRGKPVIRIENKVVNGRLYFEVHTEGETTLLNHAQFNEQVN